MATLRQLTAVEADELKKLGRDPAGFAVDEDTGEAVQVESAAPAAAPSATAPAGDYSMIGEGLKALVRGGATALSGLPRFIGEGAQQLNALGGPQIQVGQDTRSPFTQLADVIDTTASAVAPENPRFAAEHPVGAGVMSGLGQFAGMLGPALGAKLLRKPVTAALEALGPVMGAGMEGSDALQRAVAQGDTGATAVGKAGLSALGATATESLLGAGRMARKLASPAAQKVEPFLIRRLKDFGAGGTEEAIQRAIQDAVVAGELDWNSIAMEGGVGGIVQALVGVPVDLATKAGTTTDAKTTTTSTESADEFAGLGGPEEDLTTTPWKLKPLTPEDKADMIAREEWKPVIKTEFDEAVAEAKKRKILTPELLDQLYASAKPLTALDEFVRTPNASAEARAQSQAIAVKPLTADELRALRNITADEAVPVKTPLISGIQQLRKSGQTFTDADVQALNKAATKEESDKIVQSIYLRNKLAERPMTAGETAEAIQAKNWDRFGKEFKEDTKRVETAEGALQKIEKMLQSGTLNQGDRWTLTGQLEAAKADLNNARTALMQKYLKAFNPPQPALATVPPPRPEGGWRVVPPGPDVGPPQPVTPLLRKPPIQLGPGSIAEGEQRPPFAEAGSVNNPPAPETAAVSGTQAVTTSTPEAARAAAEAQQAAVPDGTTEVKPASDVINKRNEGEQNAETIRGDTGPVQESGNTGEGSQTAGGRDVQQAAPGQPESVGEVRLENKEQTAEGRVESASETSNPADYGDKTFDTADEKSVRQAMLLPKGITNLNPLKWLYSITQSIAGNFASSNPAMAYAASRFLPLFKRMNQLKNNRLAALKEFKSFLGDERVTRWLDASALAGTWDMSQLPAELRGPAQRWITFVRAFHAFQRRHDIRVRDTNADGATVFRPAEDMPGYDLTARIDPAVYDAREEGGDKWRTYRNDFYTFFRQRNPGMQNWQAQADAALAEMFPALATRSTTGGSPEFAAVRRAAGIGIPPSWKVKDRFAGAVDFVDRWAKDIAWAQVVQTDPVLRRVFGETFDPAGRDTTETDPQTFAQAPNSYRAALREGRRVGAKWADDARGHAADEIQSIFGSDELNSIRNSYMQTPIGGGVKASEHLNAFGQLAGSLLIQTKAAIRDIAQAGSALWEYVPLHDTARAVGSILESVLHPIAAVKRGQAAGAIQMDQYAHEAASVVTGAMHKAARAIRTASGRNVADAWAKAVVYNTIHDIVAFHQRHGVMSPLVEEFGPADRTGMTDAQVAEETAAAVTDRVQPTYDVKSMNKTMLPQNQNMLGAVYALSRWSIARFNKWYEDAVMPAMRGKPQRLIKSLIAGAVGSVATGEFLAWLTNQLPQHLTWREWLKMPDENKEKDKEFWLMMFGYMQAQGTMGIAGDIGYKLAKFYTGNDKFNDGIQAAYPPAIVAGDWLDKAQSFGRAAREGYVGIEDVADLGLELMKSAQNVKTFEALAGSKPDYRDRRIFEELTGLSAISGEPKAESAAAKTFAPDPFALGRRLKEAGSDVKELRKLVPTMAKRAAAGSPMSVRSEVMSPLYYVELANRRGIEVARRELEKDVRREKEMEPAKTLADMLRDLAPAE